MPYVKIEDTFFRHPKVLRVGKDAKLLAVAGICYCGNQLTDGFIPSGAAFVIAAETGVSKPQSAIKELIAAGLWDEVDGGYEAHDYLDYNTRSDKVRENREAARERMKRNRSQDVHANKTRTSPEVRECSPEVREPTTDTEGSLEPNGSAEPKSGAIAPDASPPDSKPAKPKLVERKTQIPEGFAVSDKMRSWAHGKGLTDAQIDAKTERFIRWAMKTGAKYVRWDLAWQDSMEWEDRPASSSSTNGRHPPLPQVLQPGHVPPDGGLAEYKRLYGRGSAAREGT